MEKIKNFRWGYILIALVLLLLGICFIAFTSALTVLAIGVGITLSVFGIIFGTLAVADKSRGVGFAFKLFFAILSIICGITTAIFNSGAVDVIISVFSLVMIVDASFKLYSSAISKRYYMAGWWIMTALATLTVGGGFYLIKYAPTDNVPLVSVLLGVIMIIDAIENVLAAIYITGVDGQMKREKIDPITEGTSKNETSASDEEKQASDSEKTNK